MIRNRGKQIAAYTAMGILTFFFCWLFVGKYGIFGSSVDWISQHSVIPDYFRKQFYETGNWFPEFAANIGGGQNQYHFSYYGLYSPMILISYLLPGVEMGDYIMAVSVCSLAAAVILMNVWLTKRGFSGAVSFLVSMMYLLSGPMIFHSYSQIMFVNYMPFLCMAFLGVDHYFEKDGKILYTVSVFLMIMTSFYFSIGGMLTLVLYGLHRYFQKKETAAHIWESEFINTGKKKIPAILEFLSDGIRFLLPMFTAVLMSGILLAPTAMALTGRQGGASEVSLHALFLPDLRMMRLTYSPYGIGLTALAVAALLGGLTYKKCSERILTYGCAIVLTVPFFSWILNGGLYIRDKALIPFLPLVCYLIACYLEKMEKGQITFAAGLFSFLGAAVLLYLGRNHTDYIKYGKWILADAGIMTGAFLLFWKCRRKKGRIYLLAVPPVLFLFLFGMVFHPEANRIESRENYEKAVDQQITNAVKKTLDQEEGFYRVEQVGTDRENAAALNRIRDIRQYISSLYSSSYNSVYQEFRKNVFGTEEPFRNDLMQSVSQNPVFQKLMGVKYLISEKKIPGYEQTDTVGNQKVFRNQETAPIAYVTDHTISNKTYEKLEFPYNQMALLYAAAAEKENGGKISENKDQVKETAGENTGGRQMRSIFLMPSDEMAGDVKRHVPILIKKEEEILEQVYQSVCPAEFHLPEQRTEERQIVKTENGYHIQAKKKETFALQVPVPAGEEQPKERIMFLKFRVKNYHPSKDVAVCLEGERNKLTARNHIYYNENTEFTFAVVLEKNQEHVTFTLGQGDYEILGLQCFLGDWGDSLEQERSRALYQSAFRADQGKTKGNVIAGTVDAERTGYFVTSIPYDPNFEILMDGRKIQYEKVNMAFLGFPIGKGMHRIEIRYRAPGLTAGKYLSAAGLVLLSAEILYPVGQRRRSRRKWRKKRVPAYI